MTKLRYFYLFQGLGAAVFLMIDKFCERAGEYEK